ncbi:MAG: tRNA-dihydrouridine synthase [Candidatus Moranbacteria bacterium]|nr:tRNA-dihydrouridine synthase [Candidatus Moranbacteria bacterium]
MNFWKKLKKPIFALAPMYDVTDSVFRKIIAERSNLDVVYFTEFVSVDGINHPEGRKKLEHLLWFDGKDRPIVAQLFGNNPENFKKAAQLCVELGFDGIDINTGCPEKNIIKQGAGSALIQNPELTKEIVQATIEGAGKIPVSLKTRIGFNKNEIDEWIPFLLKIKNLAALTIHLRTRKEMSLADAHWELMSEIVEMKNELNPEIILLGNGDVKTVLEARQKVEEIGCDGVMIGRGIFGNPWLFNDPVLEISLEEKLKTMIKHTDLYEKTFKGIKNFYIMKKHYKAYISGFDGASDLRAKLMEVDSADEVREIVDKFLKDRKF